MGLGYYFSKDNSIALELSKGLKPIQIGKYKYAVQKYFYYNYNSIKDNYELIVYYVITRWEPREHYRLFDSEPIEEKREIMGNNIPNNIWGKALQEIIK